MKADFDINYWLQTMDTSRDTQSLIPEGSVRAESNIVTRFPDDTDNVIRRIEATGTDITSNYNDWIKIGFAFANEYGISGRDYFHRVSRFYPGYSFSECEKQFDNCLKTTTKRTGIGSFFYLAELSGIEIKTPIDQPVTPAAESTSTLVNDKNSDSPVNDLPTLPDSVFDALPDILKKVVAKCTTNEERDILLLGSLVTLGSCLPNVSGNYDGQRIYPNLYLFVTAQASAGKGRLIHCKRLVKPVHLALREESSQTKQQYDSEMREYNLVKAKDFSIEKPAKPPEKMLFIPANNSATGVFQLLSDNKGKGLIFETEGDTLAQAFKSDYGNYSDGFRKAYHHEMISYYRRTDREYVEIENPCLSAVLSGTPSQVASLIPNAENGLFSRFIFYHMNIKPVWKNVFASGNDGLEEYFDSLGQEFFHLYKALNENPGLRFYLTDKQEKQFNAFFEQIQEKYLTLQGMDYIATIRRLGLIAFRIAMVFTMLRILETGDFSEKQVCTDDDFQTALSMIRILVKHSSHVYSELPEDLIPAKAKDRKEQFLDKLPGKFSHQDFIDLAKKMTIQVRTAERYMATFCEKGLILREQLGTYTNLTITEEDHEQNSREFCLRQQ